MDKPTEEQIKEFWEWCGLRYTVPYWVDDSNNLAFYGEVYSELLRTINLINLFKYAVPKVESLLEMVLRKIPGGYQWQINRKPKYGYEFVIGEGTTEALALFWALWQVKPLTEKPPFSVGSGGDS